MTTAHRATWSAALATDNSNGDILHGGYFIGGAHNYQMSLRDLPSHLQMKYRHTKPQIVNPDALDKKVSDPKKQESPESSHDIEEKEKLKLPDSVPDTKEEEKETNDADHNDEDNFDEFDDSDESSEKGEDSDSDEDSYDLLAAEKERIKKERELEKKLREEEERKIAENSFKKDILAEQSLFSNNGQGSIKRDWTEESVFHNQATLNKPKKRFINDTIRNDFHRAFMDKYFH